MFGPRVVGEGMERGNGESLTANGMTSRPTNVTKTNQCPRSSVRFRLKPDTSNSHEFELHRPSNKGTKLLLKVIKAIIITTSKF